MKIKFTSSVATEILEQRMVVCAIVERDKNTWWPNFFMREQAYLGASKFNSKRKDEMPACQDLSMARGKNKKCLLPVKFICCMEHGETPGSHRWENGSAFFDTWCTTL